MQNELDGCGRLQPEKAALCHSYTMSWRQLGAGGAGNRGLVSARIVHKCAERLDSGRDYAP